MKKERERRKEKKQKEKEKEIQAFFKMFLMNIIKISVNNFHPDNDDVHNPISSNSDIITGHSV